MIIYQNPVNHPVMRSIETYVRKAVEDYEERGYKNIFTKG